MSVDMHLPQTNQSSRGWNSGWKGHRGDMEKEILKTAKDYEKTVHSTNDVDQNSSPILKHMLQLRMDSHKVAKKLEGDHGYDVNPERTIQHLEDIELLSTGRSVRMPTYHAANLSEQLLESTARLRKLRDTIARNAIDKEEELFAISRKIRDAEKNGMNRFMGVRGEDKLIKRFNKTKKKFKRIESNCEEADFMNQKLDRMQWHLRKSLMRLHISQGVLEREINTISKSEIHARRKRLELYQSLAREKRNLDLIASKVNKIRTVQQIKLEEVTRCAEEHGDKFKSEKEKHSKRERRLTMQLEKAKKKALGMTATNMFKLNTKKNAIDVQLAPLEDVFYKVRVRTGMSNLTAEAIAELYIGQSDSTTLLRNEAGNAMMKLDALKDKLEERQDSLKRLQNASKETNQHKSFYAELDVVEKQLHDHVHKNERSAELARKAQLNVTCVANFVKKMARELRSLNLDRYVVEAPINVRSVDASVRDSKYNLALLEVHRVVSMLSKHVDGMTEDTVVFHPSSFEKNTTRMSGGFTNKVSDNDGGDGGGGGNTNNNNNHNDQINNNKRRGSRNNKRGVTEPTMTMDTSPMSSPMRSQQSSTAAARSAAAASLRLPQQATGNIRVPIRIAKQDNGYDSDLDDLKNSNIRDVGGGNAWETPRDGVSLRGGGGGGGGNGGGNGGGIRGRSGSKAPSVASDSSNTPLSSLFGVEEEQPGQNNQDEEEDRSCRTVRQQMKQVTNMVLYRAKKFDNKKNNTGASGGLQLPKSPRRRSIMVDNDEDDFSRLIQSVGAGSALGLGGSVGSSGMKPRKPKGKRSTGGGRKKSRRRSTMRKKRKSKMPTTDGASPTISASTEL